MGGDFLRQVGVLWLIDVLGTKLEAATLKQMVIESSEALVALLGY